MDGSVSTLAPLFATAFATKNTWDTFRVGMAAAAGAGISMGFAEALSDDGSLTGRGRPLLRGLVCGLMTALGGLGHTLPYLIPDYRTATWVAIGVVVVELGRDFLDAQPLHGHAADVGHFSSRRRRHAGVHHRHPDRQRMTAAEPHDRQWSRGRLSPPRLAGGSKYRGVSRFRDAIASADRPAHARMPHEVR